jgi:hypothetical protein
MSINILLDTLGFSQWKTVIASFALPTISLLSICLCSLSLYIFNRKRFTDSVFFYYRLLCLVYILHLLMTIPYGILFSPRYISSLNTYQCSIYHIVYAVISSFLFHYCDTLQMAILLARAKLFSPYVERKFNGTPQRISLIFFVVCFLIDFPFAFSFQVKPFGTFNTTEQNVTATFYFAGSSDFSVSPFGKILLGFTTFLLNLFLSLVVGVILNIYSLNQFKSYAVKRRLEVEELQVSSRYNKPTIFRECEQIYQKLKIERQIEKNMFYMALSLCSISIQSRVFIMFAYVYFFFYNTFSDSLAIYVITFSIFTLAPILSIFVFYLFNQMYREEFNRIVFKRSISNKVTVLP